MDKITHRGGTIQYDENTNKWRYEIEASKGSRQSLADAREAIDKYLKAEKEFTRHTALMKEHVGYGKEVLREVTVTSYDKTHWGTEAWVTWKNDQGKSERKKVRLNDLHEADEHNRKLNTEIIAIQTQVAALEDEKEALDLKLHEYKERK